MQREELKKQNTRIKFIDEIIPSMCNYRLNQCLHCLERENNDFPGIRKRFDFHKIIIFKLEKTVYEYVRYNGSLLMELNHLHGSKLICPF